MRGASSFCVCYLLGLEGRLHRQHLVAALPSSFTTYMGRVMVMMRGGLATSNTRGHENQRRDRNNDMRRMNRLNYKDIPCPACPAPNP